MSIIGRLFDTSFYGNCYFFIFTLFWFEGRYMLDLDSATIVWLVRPLSQVGKTSGGIEETSTERRCLGPVPIAPTSLRGRITW